MGYSTRFASKIAVVLLWATTSGAAFAADTTIHVSLWDKGPDSVMLDDMHQMGMGMAMTDMTMALMGLTADLTTIPAGKVTFEVTNASKDIVHEMVLTPMVEGQTGLPYVVDDYKVDEDAAGHLGEVAELDPGKSGSLTVDMVPGSYIIYCNVPGHFVNGMWAVITVTE